MKTLLLVAALLQPAYPLPAQAAAQPPAYSAIYPAAVLYSFNDVYRLTVSGAAMADFPAAAGPLRVAVTPQPQAATGFSIHEVPAPQLWLLIVAGLAAAFWVARRRMGYSF
jgi:hypothetical protein